MKFCTNCGKPADSDDQQICTDCGARFSVTTSETTPDGSPAVSNNQTVSDLPMKWYYFLSYFLLWFGALINILAGVGLVVTSIFTLTEMSAGENITNLVVFYILQGIMVTALAVFQIRTAINLIRYKQKAPKMVVDFYSLSLIANLISLFGEYFVCLSASISVDFHVESLATSLASAVVMINCNKKYFERREHLFTK